MKQFAAVLAAFVGWQHSVALAANEPEENEAAAIFDQWDAFFEEGSCWIATLPIMKDGTSPENVALYAAFHMRLPTPEISFQTEDRFAGEVVGLYVEGQLFKFEVDDDTAFASVESELRILKLLLAGYDMTVTYQLSGFDEVSGKIAASGFRDAYNFLSRSCDFQFVPDLSETLGVEPT